MGHKRTEVVTKRVIFAVPSPTPIDELDKALQAALRECAEARGKTVAALSADSVMVRSYDDEIQFYYEIEVKP